MEAIGDYIGLDNQAAAENVMQAIYDACLSLADFPHKGRRVDEFRRELVMRGLPYIILYRVRREGVEIVRIRHGAQRWKN